MATQSNENSHKNTGNGGPLGASSGFDQAEYNADIARVARLPRAQQDVEIALLYKKYNQFGIRMKTIRDDVEAAIKAHLREEMKEERAKAKKARADKTNKTKVGNTSAPPPYLKDVLADPFSTLEELIDALNTEFCFVNEGGKATVMHAIYDITLKRNLYARSTREDFKAFYENRPVEIGVDRFGNPVYEELGKLWLKSEDRKQYLGGVVFLPNGDVGKDRLNLWTGFSISPKKGSWKRLRKHIWRVVCRRNKAAFRYLMRWMASVLQHPELQGYAFVVMRGEKGAGKGIVAAPFLRILGSHSLHIFDAEHLVGCFNLHLQACSFIFVDEALFAGDVKHESILKRLVTEPTLPIEAKFRDLVEARNFLHGMMASNSDWVVPAGLRERRFLVLDVSDEYVGNNEYFAAVRKEMEQDGGDAAMMFDLMNLDISDFNPADIPETEGLLNQKRLTLPLEYRWLEDVLSRGYVINSKLGDCDDVTKWFEDVSVRALFMSYEAFMDKQRVHFARRMTDAGIGKFMRKLGFTHNQCLTALDGEKRDVIGGDKSYAKLNARKGISYHLGTLDDARKQYFKATKLLDFDLTEMEEEIGDSTPPTQNPPRPSFAGAPANDDADYYDQGSWIDGVWVLTEYYKAKPKKSVLRCINGFGRPPFTGA